MKAKIALATVSGRAYYRLVNELKGKDVPFLSLKPGDRIPLDIKVIITTDKECHLITHPNVLVFDSEADPATVVNEAIRVVQGKRSYDKVVIGVDPGKTFGVAILGDGNVLETVDCSTLEETLSTILEALDRAPAIADIVKVGNGAPVYTKELLRLLDESLPKEVIIEIVSEAGTSHFISGATHRRRLRDVMSAIIIAGRKGQVFPRRKVQ